MIALGEQNNLRFNDTSMSYRIGEYNKNLFVSAHVNTVGSFPGFKLNNRYRVYISYFNATDGPLNLQGTAASTAWAGGQPEMSLFDSPMIRASPPQVRPRCISSSNAYYSA